MKNSKLYIAILSAALSSNFLHAEAEVTGQVIHESADYLYDGITTGTTTAHDNDKFKSETRIKVFVDGEVNDDMTYHIEAQGFKDPEAVANHQSSKSYTKRDPLREAYIDTNVNDWALRLGKQQVVWGTADGMKLLDNINPTDFTEMAQDQMADSRIPVWMLNAEKFTEDGGNFQVVLSQPKENIFAGLDRNISTATRDNATAVVTNEKGDWDTSTDYAKVMDMTDATTALGHSQGNPFVLLGVDSITGKKNGFLNIVPDIGSIAQRFYNEFSQNTVAGHAALLGAKTTTVGWFASQSASTLNTAFGSYQTIDAFTAATDRSDDDGGAGYGYDGAQVLGGFASAYDTNLINTASYDVYGTEKKDSAFEYMQNATFSTFDAFAGAKSQYVYNMPDDTDLDLSMRYKNTLGDGSNYSLNYSYAYDKNPIINLSWRNSSGDKLTVNKVDTATNYTSLTLTDSSNTRYGAFGGSSSSGGEATLRFEETVKRAHNIGGSFDTTIETDTFGPMVLRLEGLYQKDVYTPIMNLTELSIGNLTEALKMEKGDRFKYVIGADITALTNMMISAQFIQDRNLDYIDTTATHNGISLAKYTTDYATMHLTNGFNKAAKNKNFYSLYLSKPYGESGQHRWNNITIFEETGGYWNRLDTEYSLDDNTILNAELNTYWGKKDTQFGQLEDSSNIQVGVKYSF